MRIHLVFTLLQIFFVIQIMETIERTLSDKAKHAFATVLAESFWNSAHWVCHSRREAMFEKIGKNYRIKLQAMKNAISICQYHVKMHKFSIDLPEIFEVMGIKLNDVKSTKEEELLKKVLTKMVDEKVELYLTDDEMKGITEGKKESASEKMSDKTHCNSNGLSQKHAEKKDMSNVSQAPPFPAHHSNLKKEIHHNSQIGKHSPNHDFDPKQIMIPNKAHVSSTESAESGKIKIEVNGEVAEEKHQLKRTKSLEVKHTGKGLKTEKNKKRGIRLRAVPPTFRIKRPKAKKKIKAKTAFRESKDAAGTENQQNASANANATMDSKGTVEAHQNNEIQFAHQVTEETKSVKEIDDGQKGHNHSLDGIPMEKLVKAKNPLVEESNKSQTTLISHQHDDKIFAGENESNKLDVVKISTENNVQHPVSNQGITIGRQPSTEVVGESAIDATSAVPEVVKGERLKTFEWKEWEKLLLDKDVMAFDDEAQYQFANILAKSFRQSADPLYQKMFKKVGQNCQIYLTRIKACKYHVPMEKWPPNLEFKIATFAGVNPIHESSTGKDLLKLDILNIMEAKQVELNVTDPEVLQEIKECRGLAPKNPKFLNGVLIGQSEKTSLAKETPYTNFTVIHLKNNRGGLSSAIYKNMPIFLSEIYLDGVDITVWENAPSIVKKGEPVGHCPVEMIPLNTACQAQFQVDWTKCTAFDKYVRIDVSYYYRYKKKDDGTVEKISHHGFVKIWDVEHCPVELRPELFKPAGELLIDVTNAAAEVSKVDLKKQPWLNAEGCLRNK